LTRPNASVFKIHVVTDMHGQQALVLRNVYNFTAEYRFSIYDGCRQWPWSCLETIHYCLALWRDFFREI